MYKCNLYFKSVYQLQEIRGTKALGRLATGLRPHANHVDVVDNVKRKHEFDLITMSNWKKNTSLSCIF